MRTPCCQWILNTSNISFILRLTQFSLTLGSLILFSRSFKGLQTTLSEAGKDPVVITTHLGGPTINFVLILTFAATLYSFLWIVFVYLTQRVKLSLPAEHTTDAIFTVLMLSGGCACAASDYVRYCERMQTYIRCDTLKIATVLMLFSFAAFLTSVVWGAMRRGSKVPKQTKQPKHRTSASYQVGNSPIPRNESNIDTNFHSVRDQEQMV